MDGTKAWLAAAWDETAQRDLERQLKHQVSHDELTALPNRGSFVTRLQVALRHRDRRRLAVMLLDVDDFEAVNDGYGHVLGDILLMEMAVRIKSCVRGEDTVARLGSDEFALLIEENGDETAAEITRRVLDALDEPFLLPGSPGVSASASIGIAFPDKGEGAGELLRNAGVALNVARRRGMRAVTFADAMHREVRRRISIEATLNRAVRDPAKHFALVYQPVYATVGRRIVGFEALLRWEDPGLGSIPPAELIPVAEATGAIVSLGRWVLNRACCQAAE